MYIEPNTVIRLLKNCPLDNTYDHTIYFDNSEKQYTYFAGLTKYTLSRQTYQRVNQSRMRVQYKADDLYDCNYLMFQNTSFGNKWFYAFIKSVEYVNNITSEIVYEIDVMQTWAFDYHLGQCLVDREHSGTDNIGDNLVPENLERGEPICTEQSVIFELIKLNAVLAATFKDDGSRYYGGMWGGVFTGLHYKAFPNTLSGTGAMVDYMQTIGDEKTQDGVISIFAMPENLVPDENSEAAKTFNVTKPKITTMLRADGTEVKNKKLLTYPYNYLYVTNQQGNSAAFRYEYFDTHSDECVFNVTGDISPVPGVILTPENYNGADINYAEQMTLGGYPQLCWSIDTFRAWIAQNGSSSYVNALSSAFGGVTRVAATQAALQSAGTAGATAAAGISATAAPIALGLMAAGVVAQVYEHSITPNQAKGSLGGQTLLACNRLNFLFQHMQIRPEFASIIDDYFTMFGYASHIVKIPNRNVRPHWTYTKTVGCVVHGSVPCDDMNKICRIYDNGITFWKNGDEIGNYSLDNSV